MSIHAQLTQRETRIAEDMASVLDKLSRVIQGLDGGNLHYAEEKAWQLLNDVEALHRHLDSAVKNADQEPAVRPDLLTAAITEFARHYAAGRALYPIDSDQDGAR